MLYTREARGTVDEVTQKLEAAAQENSFGVLTVHNLNEKMAAKGVEFIRQYRIVEVCNPMQARAVLETDISVSTALPCRISVYEENGKVKVATMKPTEVLKLFGDPELQGVAREVEEVIIRIMDAACE
jgi:uncharacterized protein (DUF302 family)